MQRGQQIRFFEPQGGQQEKNLWIQASHVQSWFVICKLGAWFLLSIVYRSDVNFILISVFEVIPITDSDFEYSLLIYGAFMCTDICFHSKPFSLTDRDEVESSVVL